MDCINAAYTVQPDFIHACQLADTPPTKRQASRFRMGKGRAYKVNRIIHSAPPVPSWFEPKMEPQPPEIQFNAKPPKEGATPEEIKASEDAALELMQRIETRNSERAAWKTRFRIQAAEQWPKAWALRSLGL